MGEESITEGSLSSGEAESAAFRRLPTGGKATSDKPLVVARRGRALSSALMGSLVGGRRDSGLSRGSVHSDSSVVVSRSAGRVRGQGQSGLGGEAGKDKG